MTPDLILDPALPARGARRRVAARAPWDWGSAAFSAVITTFVLTRWLTSDAGLVIAALAPVTGSRSDASGPRRTSLAVSTFVAVSGREHWGVLGIMLVLAVGLALVVRPPVGGRSGAR